jgi:aspartate racemase
VRTIGLIGGMSWVASGIYYRLINEAVQQELGGHANAPSVMVTVDFARLEALQRAGDWEAASAVVADAAVGLERAGAECVVICANTMHVAAAAVRAAVPDLPLLHIGDATAAAMKAAGEDRAVLLGTRYTMELPFLRDHLREQHGIETDVPGPDERAELQRIIYEELTRDRVEPAAQAFVRGLGGPAILGCTELTLLGVPGFDTTRLHAQAAAAFAMTPP